MSSDEDDFKHRIGGARPSVGRKHAASPAQFSLRSSKKLNTASLGGLIPAVLRPLPHNVLPEGRAQLRALFSGRQHDGSAGGAAPAAGGQCEWQSNAVEYATGSADAWEDLAAAAVDAEGPDGPDVEIDLLQSDDDSGSTSSTAQEEEQQQQQATDGDPGGGAAALLSWLAERGLEKYGADFSRAGATLALLPCLTDVDLQQIGIVALGARKKVLLGAAELAAPAPAPPAARAVASGAGHFGALAASFGIASYFAAPPQPEGNTPAATGGGSILRFLRGPDGQAPKAPLGAPQALAASKALYKKGAKEWAHSGTTAARGGGGQRGGRPAAPQPFKSWQLVAGTSFVVDRFNNLPPTPPQQCHWFLTHFHADHYKGLTSK
jgi:DNA cross-link repair 1A protein